MCAIAQAALERLVIEDQDFADLEASLIPYCPFEAMGMVKAEIRHSNFLANLLDPHRPHGFGAAFLKRFLDEVMRLGGLPSGVSRLDLHLADLERADARREWRRIDVLLCLPDLKLVIAIELKIGASEGAGQLERYSRALEEEWPRKSGWTHLRYFLTREGEAASDPEWQPIDYGTVADAIDAVLASGNSGHPLARATAKAYADMLRRRHLNNPELERLARAIWQRHAEALTFLMERQPDAAGDMLAMMRKRRSELVAAARASGLDVQPANGSGDDLTFVIHDWDYIQEIHIGKIQTHGGRVLVASIELRSDVNKIRAQLILGPCVAGGEQHRKAIFDATKAAAGKAHHMLRDQWKWLATQKLYQEKETDAGQKDEQKLFEEACKAFGTFFEKDVKPISDALLSAFPKNPASTKI